MADMTVKRQAMPLLENEKRRTTFFEVALGYSEETALKEASRCLNCKNMPCVSGCPVNVHIPQFIEKMRKLDFEGAYKIIAETSSLPAVCGRVCPQETQCEAKCVRGIKGESVAIGRLERFCADYHNLHSAESAEKPQSNGFKVAVVGSGPSGLSCAGFLAKNGFKVTVFEALHKAGGVLVYGIPEFRLPKKIVQREVDNLLSLGVEIKTDTVIGKTFTVKELKEEYDAVFIGSGAGLPMFMGIDGEGLKGVYSANEYLTRVNLMNAYLENSDTPIMKSKTVAVVGGGNVAMDAARTAKRLGAENVYIVYRRSEKELPARREEVEHAKEEGIIFNLLTNPVKINGYLNKEDKFDSKNGFVSSVTCVKMELGEPDERGRRRPIEIKGSEFDIEVDTVIMALGTKPNPLIKSTTEGLNFNQRGGITVDEETAETSLENVYAGGDAVTGAATVISAMGAGLTAGKAIKEKFSVFSF